MKSSLITYSRWDAVQYSNMNVPAQAAWGRSLTSLTSSSSWVTWMCNYSAEGWGLDLRDIRPRRRRRGVMGGGGVADAAAYAARLAFP